MFNTAKPHISKETQDLLNLMMRESKLTNFQKRKLNSNIRDGKSLPTSCNPTSSQSKQRTSSAKTFQPKVLNGRHLAMSGKRKKNMIDTLVQAEADDVYRPLPRKLITDKDKEKLQNKMAYGVNIPEVTALTLSKNVNVEEEEDIDEFDEVLSAIEERRQFLDDMESLGQGTKYRSVVQTEISQKIRELEVIDKKRMLELEVALRAEQTKET